MVSGNIRAFRADRPIKDVYVALSEVADVSPLTDQRFLITAKKGGRTSVTVIHDDIGQPTHIEVLVVEPIAYQRDEIRVRKFLKGQTVDNRFYCDSLTGCTPDPENKGFVDITSTTVTLPGGATATTVKSTGVGGH
jgi:hypothetical protein